MQVKESCERGRTGEKQRNKERKKKENLRKKI
jgi:hypothetical protein